MSIVLFTPQPSIIRRIMANNPIPDQSKDFVQSGMVLITDPKADKYLNMAQKRRERSTKPKES